MCGKGEKVSLGCYSGRGEGRRGEGTDPESEEDDEGYGMGAQPPAQIAGARLLLLLHCTEMQDEADQYDLTTPKAFWYPYRKVL